MKKLDQVRHQNFSVQGEGYGPEDVHNLLKIMSLSITVT